jgi:hypothetical protein
MKPQVWNYTLLCITCSVIILMALAEQRLWPWGLLPAGVAFFATIFRMRSGSALFLLALCGVLLVDNVRRPSISLSPFYPSTLLLCGAALAFVIGHGRLLSLTLGILPRDLRRDEWLRTILVRRGQTEVLSYAPQQRHADGTSSGGEIMRMLLLLPLWLTVGELAWAWLSHQTTTLTVNPSLWRLATCLLGGSLLLLTAHMVFTLWRFATLSKSEAHMILQDAQWWELRREQQIVSRWVAWARQQLGRKENA